MEQKRMGRRRGAGNGTGADHWASFTVCGDRRTNTSDSRPKFDDDGQEGMAISCRSTPTVLGDASGPGAQQSLLISFGPMIDAMTPFSLKTEAPYGR